MDWLRLLLGVCGVVVFAGVMVLTLAVLLAGAVLWVVFEGLVFAADAWEWLVRR